MITEKYVDHFVGILAVPLAIKLENSVRPGYCLTALCNTMRLLAKSTLSPRLLTMHVMTWKDSVIPLSLNCSTSTSPLSLARA